MFMCTWALARNPDHKMLPPDVGGGLGGGNRRVGGNGIHNNRSRLNWLLLLLHHVLLGHLPSLPGIHDARDTHPN